MFSAYSPWPASMASARAKIRICATTKRNRIPADSRRRNRNTWNKPNYGSEKLNYQNVVFHFPNRFKITDDERQQVCWHSPGRFKPCFIEDLITFHNFNRLWKGEKNMNEWTIIFTSTIYTYTSWPRERFGQTPTIYIYTYIYNKISNEKRYSC